MTVISRLVSRTAQRQQTVGFPASGGFIGVSVFRCFGGAEGVTRPYYLLPLLSALSTLDSMLPGPISLQQGFLREKLRHSALASVFSSLGGNWPSKAIEVILPRFPYFHP